jgi:hypothetical protein
MKTKMLILILTIGLIFPLLAGCVEEEIPPTSSYILSILDPSQGLVKIDYTVNGIGNKTITFEFPYPELNISPSSINFVDGRGNSLIPVKSSDTSWSLNTPTTKTVKVSYTLNLPKLYQQYIGHDSSYLEEEWGLITWSSFICAKEFFDSPIDIDFNLPSGWEIATTLEKMEKNRFEVSNFRELGIRPTLIGHFERAKGGRQDSC